MIALLSSLVLLTGQAISHTAPVVVHLQPQRGFITGNFGGKLLELIDAPTVVYLPDYAPKLDAGGRPWQLDIKNAGPSSVTIAGKNHFQVDIEVGQTVHIGWNGATYSLRH